MLFFSTEISSLLQSTYINTKIKELVLRELFVTFHTRSETPREITELSFSSSPEKSYKIHITQQGHMHQTMDKVSKQPEELLFAI